MKRFYEFYPNARKLPQFVAVSRENQNLPQIVADFEQQTSIVLTSDDSDQLVFNISSMPSIEDIENELRDKQ
jgi:hypothetical protein